MIYFIDIIVILTYASSMSNHLTIQQLDILTVPKSKTSEYIKICKIISERILSTPIGELNFPKTVIVCTTPFKAFCPLSRSWNHTILRHSMRKGQVLGAEQRKIDFELQQMRDVKFGMYEEGNHARHYEFDVLIITQQQLRKIYGLFDDVKIIYLGVQS